MVKKVCQGHAGNLETIKAAAANGDLALIECRRVKDGEIVALLAAVGWDGQEYTFTPLAEMVNGNPYELYQAPLPEGGFAPVDEVQG